MNKGVLISLFILAFQFSFSQTFPHSDHLPKDVIKNVKLVIDSSAIHDWDQLGSDDELGVSSDGRYISYSIISRGRDTLFVQSIDGGWKKVIPGGHRVLFSRDSRLFVFKNAEDLSFLTLGADKLEVVHNISSYKMPDVSSKKNGAEWLAYIYEGENKGLELLNLVTGKKIRYGSTADYYFNDQGTALVFKKVVPENAREQTSLNWVNLSDLKTEVFYSGYDSTITNLVLNSAGTGLAFGLRYTQDDKSKNSLFYFEPGMKTAVIKYCDSANEGLRDYTLSEYFYFSLDDRYIYVYLMRQEQGKHDSAMSRVNIWNYLDIYLQSFQIGNLGNDFYSQLQYSIGVIPLDKGSIRIVRQAGTPDFIPRGIVKNGDFALLYHRPNGYERYWVSQKKDSNWLLSVKDGSRTFLNTGRISDDGLWKCSPDGRFLVYFDPASGGDYFSYDMLTKTRRRISASFPGGYFKYHNEYSRGKPCSFEVAAAPVGVDGWLNESDGILVSDDFDMWILDLKGVKAPINITNGYGRAHHIKFRLAQQEEADNMLSDTSSLLLTAFNVETKYNGFFSVVLNKRKDPELLTMGPYHYYHSSQKMSSSMDFVANMKPVKAGSSHVWIVKRDTYNEAPNYFYSYNLKDFVPITHVCSETKYNWLTAELLHWPQLDGTRGQGILYKPDNFDPKKTYPLIITYYRDLSHRLYEYPVPELMETAGIDIAWFVSRGYMVLTPDIYFSDNKNGQGAYNTVLSAVKYISKRKYINSNKIGINGHSFAGGLTNYLITHTNVFAAAFEGAGSSDYVSTGLEISSYGPIPGDDRLFSIEHPQGNLWQQKELCLKSSPILFVDRITTPLLIFHCEKDNAMPFEQAMELFLAMWRLDKKVWLLQYDEGTHFVYLERDAQDLTKRATQFFDHFLKGTPQPVWMSQGVPARLKGITNGMGIE